MGSVTERVDSLIAAGDLDSVAGVCDEFEIVAGGAGNVPEWPHATHVLSRMLAGDLERARCVLERAPEHLRERDPELRAVHAVLAPMLDRDQPAVPRPRRTRGRRSARPRGVVDREVQGGDAGSAVARVHHRVVRARASRASA